MLAATGWRGLNYSCIQVWSFLAAGGLLAGITWRWLGTGPTVFQLLDCLGLAYWLVPVLLIHSWELMRCRQLLHFSRGINIYSVALKNALRMLVNLLCISLAPLGLLIAYNELNPAAHIRTELFDFQIGYGEFVLLVLALLGTVLLFLSLVCLVMARRIAGPHNGILLWVLAGIGLNVSVVTGSKLGDVYLSLGGFAVAARGKMNAGLLDTAQIVYLDELASSVIGIPLALLAGLLLLATLAQIPQQIPKERLRAYWAPGLVGIVLPALFAMSHTSQWIGDLSQTYPWPWAELFLVGFIPMLSLYAILAWQVEPTVPLGGDKLGLAFISLAPVSWMVFSIPIVQAGQVGKPQLALACCVSILLIWVWIALVNALARFRQLNPGLSGVLLAAIIAIPVIPITGSHHSGLATLLVDLSTAFAGSQQIWAVWVAGMAVACIGVATWLGARRNPAN